MGRVEGFWLLWVCLKVGFEGWFWDCSSKDGEISVSFCDKNLYNSLMVQCKTIGCLEDDFDLNARLFGWASQTSHFSKCFVSGTSSLLQIGTVDGSEIRRLPVEVGKISHYLQDFSTTPGGWEWDFWTINNIIHCGCLGSKNSRNDSVAEVSGLSLDG